jgi:hypothetical protein
MARSRERVAAGQAGPKTALERLRREADGALAAGPFSVINKRLVPPSGDKHDYMSVAPYWWPDPGRPDGLPYVRHDGKRNPARYSADTDSVTESAMAAAVETLGLAYYFTEHRPYADHAARLLRVWFLDPATRMNPNLNFSQAIQGVVAGRPPGVIDTVDLITMLDAVEILHAARALTEADDRGLRAWFAAFVQWLTTSEIGRGEAAAGNNHGSWYDAQVCRFALFAGRDDLAREVVRQVAAARIAQQIQPDGTMPRELERTRSYHYSVFNLVALFSLADMGARLGTDLYGYQSPDGRSLRRALEYLLPYLDPAVAWPYPQLGARDREPLVPLLRRAHRGFHDTRYHDLVGRFLAPEAADHRAELVLP